MDKTSLHQIAEQHDVDITEDDTHFSLIQKILKNEKSYHIKATRSKKSPKRASPKRASPKRAASPKRKISPKKVTKRVGRKKKDAVEEPAKHGDDWDQDDCPDGKVKNPKGNCVNACGPGKMRNVETGRCIKKPGGQGQGQGQGQGEDSERIPLDDLNITRLKEVAKSLGMSGVTKYTKKDIDVLKAKIEEEQDKKFGAKEPMIARVVRPPVSPERPARPASPVQRPVSPVRPVSPPKRQVSPVKPISPENIVCNHCGKKGHGKPRCPERQVYYDKKDQEKLGNLIGSKKTIEKLKGEFDDKNMKNASEDNIREVLKELGDSPDDLNVLKDPGIKNLIQCLFKK
jgi:hypothetical protein